VTEEEFRTGAKAAPVEWYRTKPPQRINYMGTARRMHEQQENARLRDTLASTRPPKPHFRIRSDGWIVHDGGECPVPPWTRVQVEYESRVWPGKRLQGAVVAARRLEKGGDWWKTGRITAYRIA